jgi:hypothetical protein
MGNSSRSELRVFRNETSSPPHSTVKPRQEHNPRVQQTTQGARHHPPQPRRSCGCLACFEICQGRTEQTDQRPQNMPHMSPGCFTPVLARSHSLAPSTPCGPVASQLSTGGTTEKICIHEPQCRIECDRHKLECDCLSRQERKCSSVFHTTLPSPSLLQPMRHRCPGQTPNTTIRCPITRNTTVSP